MVPRRAVPTVSAVCAIDAVSLTLALSEAALRLTRCLCSPVESRIHRDYARTLDVSTLAREAGMSVSTFHAHFKAITAKPPLRYQQTVRFHKARVLMAGAMPVAAAARQVGYESPSQFSREFKRLFGITPKDAARCPENNAFLFY